MNDKQLYLLQGLQEVIEDNEETLSQEEVQEVLIELQATYVIENDTTKE